VTKVMSGLSVENKVVVKIFGEEYPITGSGDPAHISKIADLVDSRMQEIARQGRTRARDKVAILTAMSLASELLEKSDGLSDLQHDRDDRLAELLGRLDSALADN
jgi:cell division protein ZapA